MTAVKYFDTTSGTWKYVLQGPKGDPGDIQSITAGAGITVDATDSANPTVAAPELADKVSGPASAADGAIVVFSGTDGKTVADGTTHYITAAGINASETVYTPEVYTDTVRPNSASTITMAAPIVLPADPTTALEAATKQYIDIGVATLTNKRLQPRVSLSAGTATLTPDVSNFDHYYFTSLAVNLSVAAPIGSPAGGEKLLIRIKDNGTARSITWDFIYRGIGITLPSTTVVNKRMYIGMVYNAFDMRWDCIGFSQEA